MKVCHLTSVHSRTDPRIRLKECASLARAGHEVILLVADGLGDEAADGIRIVDAGKRPASRKARFVFSARAMLAAARAVDAELYHFHDPELIFAGLALKRAGKLVVYDAHEDLPRQLLSKPYIAGAKARIVAACAELLEDYAARRLDAVVTVTAKIAARFGRHARRTVLVANYPSLEELAMSELEPGPRGHSACYLGGLSVIRGARELGRAARLCKHRLVVAGPFDTPSLQEEVLGADGAIDYRGVLGRKAVGSLLRECNSGVVTFLPMPNHLEALPTKMFEYMAAGLPVIASNFPLWKEIVEGNDCGICVDPTDPEAIAGAVNRLAAAPDEAARLGANGRKLVLGSCNWSIEARKLLALYEELEKNT